LAISQLERIFRKKTEVIAILSTSVEKGEEGEKVTGKGGRKKKNGFVPWPKEEKKTLFSS